MNSILFGVDGTGDMNDATYAREMMHSFVRRILWHSPIPGDRKRYIRGPDWSGAQVVPEAYHGYDFIKRNLSSYPGSSVLLTGYSRGGAAAITIAQMLQRDGLPVRAMVLFDAVDRAAHVDCASIPGNVANVYHARRDMFAAWSRVSFGNCGTFAVPPTVYKERYFRCTHGAMGGTHWTGGPDTEMINEHDVTGPTAVTYQQDREVEPLVWGWVYPWLRQFDFL
jgi:hypothetical protein